MTAGLAVALAVAALLGAAAHRGGLCTVRAVAEMLTTRRAHILWSFLKASLWTTSFLALAAAAGHAAPLETRSFDEMAVAGGLLFGMGAAMNGACALSTFARLAEGHVAMAFAPLGWLAGMAALARAAPPMARRRRPRCRPGSRCRRSSGSARSGAASPGACAATGSAPAGRRSGRSRSPCSSWPPATPRSCSPARRALVLDHQRGEGLLGGLVDGQRELALPGKAPPRRQLLRRDPVPARHVHHARARLEGLQHDPRLHLVGPRPPDRRPRHHLQPFDSACAPPANRSCALSCKAHVPTIATSWLNESSEPRLRKRGHRGAACQRGRHA